MKVLRDEHDQYVLLFVLLEALVALWSGTYGIGLLFSLPWLIVTVLALGFLASLRHTRWTPLRSVLLVFTVAPFALGFASYQVHNIQEERQYQD